MTEEQKNAERWKYIRNSLGPDIIFKTPFDIAKATKGTSDMYGNKPDLGKVLAGDILGIRAIADTSSYRYKLLQHAKMNMSLGLSDIKKRLFNKEISPETAQLMIRNQYKKYQQELKTH